ncbi:hypothetical protein MN116_003171 [Schistosoma mekongi]|uniref:VWFA domain-containing protein n=1 Tax=Schistosoma mekongi TaxID=38744 RepID=A0AAE1ZH26_SCHME|nr:hypothetical protein MN116_003171 [Schistosoma mekongi]
MLWLKILILSIILSICNTDITQDEECLKSIKADIVFLLDGTKAIDKFSFEFYVKDYLNDLAKKLSVKRDGALISVILFTNKLHFAVKPEHSVNLPTLLTSIRNMKQPDGDEMKADIIHAISNILNIGFISTNNLDTRNITRIVILLTNGDIPENYHNPSNKQIQNKYILRKSETVIQNLHSHVNYVFSIGIPGANEQGVRRLAKPLQYAFTLTKFGGYKELDLKHFDPTEVMCPIKNYCNEIKRLLNLKRPIEKVNGQTFPTNPYYQYPLRQRYLGTRQQINRYPYSDYEYYYDYGEYPDRRQSQMRSVNRPNYQSKGDDKSNFKLSDLLYLLKIYEASKQRTGSENIPHITATTTEAETTTTTASPNYYNSLYYKQPEEEMYKKGQDIPISVLPSHLKSKVNNQKNDKLSIDDSMMVKQSDKNCEVRLNKIKSILLKLLEHSQQQNDSNLSINDNSKRINNTPTKTLKPVLANYPIKNLRSSHLQAFTYNIPTSANEEYKVNKSLINNNNSQTTQQYRDEKYHSVYNTNFRSTDWEDSAMHNGAILMFAIKSHSGIPINQIYSSGRNITSFSNVHANLNIKRTNHRTDYTDNSSRLSSRWYKHDLFDQWYSGLYKYVLLELWSNDNPVVQLKFNARYSDKYSWFNKLFLKSSYPWNEYELIEKSTFLRTSNEPFSILFDPNYINLLSSVDHKIIEKLKGEHINCQHLRGYILIVDSPNSAISQCEWSNATNLKYKTSFRKTSDHDYPKLFYTLPVKLSEDVLNYQLPPRFSNYSSALYEANELRVYVIPHSLMSNKNDEISLPQIGQLLFVLDIDTEISFNILWYQEIASPPSSFPLKHNKLCNCWYRNELLNNWYKPTHYHSQKTNHYSISNSFLGFQSIRIELFDQTGRVKCYLIFETYGAQVSSWFSSSRLKYSWPWSIKTLSNYNFVQFGDQILTSGKKHRLSSKNWSNFNFWIGRKAIIKSFNNKETNNTTKCLSIFLVYSKANKAEKLKLPECMKDQIDLFNNISKLTILAFSKDLVEMNNMEKVQQIAIWSN